MAEPTHISGTVIDRPVDDAVINGELVGASLAWGLAKAGAKVRMFDHDADRLHAIDSHVTVTCLPCQADLVPRGAAGKLPLAPFAPSYFASAPNFAPSVQILKRMPAHA